MRVLVTAGGGGDGFAVMSAYLAALSALPEGAAASLLVAGPLMSPYETEALTRAVAKRRDAVLAPETHDLPALIARAEIIVTMGGYNTTAEILAARKEAIIIPRSAPRVEQLLRAKCSSASVWATSSRDGPDLAQRVAGMMSEIMAGRRGLEARWNAIDLEGAGRTATALEELVPAKRSARRTAYFVKRYPRLSETFILNEIHAMETLGEYLEMFSLLQPEPPPHHPLVEQVRASLAHLPSSIGRKLKVLARAHSATLAAAPIRYARALGSPRDARSRRLRRSRPGVSSLRAGFFADEARRRGVTHLHAHFANAPAEVAELRQPHDGTPVQLHGPRQGLISDAMRRSSLSARRPRSSSRPAHSTTSIICAAFCRTTSIAR